MKSLILFRKSERFTLLNALYRKTNGMTGMVCNLLELASQEGMNFRAFKSVFSYLCHEELIRLRPSGEGFADQYYASISDAGIYAIEEVFRDENAETPYFPSFREMMV